MMAGTGLRATATRTAPGTASAPLIRTAGTGPRRRTTRSPQSRPAAMVKANAVKLAAATVGEAPVTTESGPLSGQLAELISSPVPVASGLTFSAAAATFDASPSKNLVLVTLEADGKDLTLKPEAGRYVGKIDTLIVAFDRDGAP